MRPWRDPYRRPQGNPQTIHKKPTTTHKEGPPVMDTPHHIPDDHRRHVVTLGYYPPTDEVTLSVRYWDDTHGRTWALRIPEALFRVIQRAIQAGVEPAEAGAEWVEWVDLPRPESTTQDDAPDQATADHPPPVLQDAELAKARVLAEGLEESMRAARMAVGLPPLPFAELSKAQALAEALLESLDAMEEPSSTDPPGGFPGIPTRGV